MKKNNLIYWIVAIILVGIAGWSAVHMHHLESKNAVKVSREMKISSSISRHIKKITKEQKKAMRKKVDWNKPSMTKAYPDVSKYKNVKKSNRIRLVVSSAKQRVYVMSGPYVLYTMYASLGKNYDSKTPNYQVTPVGKFKLEEARGDKFYDATRQLGGLHWTSFKGKGMYHFQSVPVDENGKVIEKDTLITSQRPILIYDSISIAPDAHLTLAAGTRLYFHGKAGMQIHGRLSVEGTLSAPVVFRGDRTDRMFPYLPYDRLPGQWGGLRFYKTSYENHLVYADIHGGSFGIRCDSSMTDRRKLTLESSIIRQVSGNGLELTSCQVAVGNSEISNAGENCVSLLGGDYTFTHCTLANYFSWNVRKGVALQVRNELDDTAYPLSSAIFRNCIIAGSGTDEINGGRSKNENIAFNYYFSHCLINSIEEENDKIVNVIWEKDDNFMLMDNHTQEYNFNLGEKSKAINWGRKEDANTYPIDRNGHSRLQDVAPDAGCYESMILPSY